MQSLSTNNTSNLRSIELVIPFRAVPKVRMTQRSKWYPRARRTLEFQQIVAAFVRARNPPIYASPVELTCRFYFRDRRHGDLKNYIAAIEDALQYAGVLANDKLVLRYGAGTGIYYDKNERIELKIRPLAI